MNAFNESNTVEAYLYDLLSGPAKSVPTSTANEPQTAYGRASKGPSTSLRTGLGWRRVTSTDIPRQPQEARRTYRRKEVHRSQSIPSGAQVRFTLFSTYGSIFPGHTLYGHQP